MAWDATLPADLGTITVGQQGIRDNWTALNTTISVDHHPMEADEEGKHKKVSLFELTDDPNSGAQVANTGFVYTKDDSGATEAFYMDAEATPNKIQLTKSGKIYTPATNAPLGVAVAWAYCNSAGVLQEGYNLTTSGAGQTKTFTFAGEITAMANTTYVVVPSGEGSGFVKIYPVTKNTGTFTVTGYRTSASVDYPIGMNVVVYGQAT